MAKVVTYLINIKRVIRRQFSLCIADGVMKVDGNLVYEAKNLRVGVFAEMDNT